jgi:chaperonin GroES
MNISERGLGFIDREIASRREQREYLSEDEGSARGRSLFLRLSGEIEVLGYLRGLVSSGDNCLTLPNKNKNMSKFKPLADRIQIKPDEQASHTGNFVIPDSAKEKPVTGTVVAAGPLVNPDHICIGDRVVYSSSAGVTVEIDGELVTYLMERDCHFVISNN